MEEIIKKVTDKVVEELRGYPLPDQYLLLNEIAAELKMEAQDRLQEEYGYGNGEDGE